MNLPAQTPQGASYHRRALWKCNQ